MLFRSVVCLGPKGERTVALPDFITDAFSTSLGEGEIIKEVRVAKPKAGSGGAYIAFKRCAPVYASASAAVQLTIESGACQSANIFLGAVGLTALHAREAETALIGNNVDAKTISAAAEAAMASAQPQSDQRGSADYKRQLVRGLVTEAIEAAVRRATGGRVEVTHHYA